MENVFTNVEALLRRADGEGEAGKEEFEERFRMFEAGEWSTLVEQARAEE